MAAEGKTATGVVLNTRFTYRSGAAVRTDERERAVVIGFAMIIRNHSMEEV